jgi:pleiotropic regulator 1
MTTLTHHKKSVRALAIAPHEYTFASASAGGNKLVIRYLGSLAKC